MKTALRRGLARVALSFAAAPFAALPFAALPFFAMPLAAQEATDRGTGVELRALDKLTGQVTDLAMATGQSARVGRIEVVLDECRYPTGDPAGDAYAFLTVEEQGDARPVYRGWMIATAPALNPMDHPRYDVWVLRCTTA